MTERYLELSREDQQHLDRLDRIPAKESREAKNTASNRSPARSDLPRDERLRVWHERTNKSEAALYRRLDELDRFSCGEK